MENAKIAIVIPAYNEENTIFDIVTSSGKYGSVIVIDDCSHDKTNLICSKLNCKLIVNKENKGYEASLWAGICAASNFDYIITIDADGEIPTKYIFDVIKALNEGAELVLGQRKKFPRWGEVLINYISKLLFGVPDLYCGLKGYKNFNQLEKVRWKGTIGTGLSLYLLKKKVIKKIIEIEVNERIGKSRFGNNGLKTNFKLISIIKYMF